MDAESELLIPPKGPEEQWGQGASSFFCKVFCFVARSHGPTGVKPGGGLHCVGTAEVN